MNVSFEYCKTLALEAAILMILAPIPYIGWVLGIIGVILLVRAMKEFSNYYEDKTIYDNTLTGVKYYVVAIIALAVTGGFVAVAALSATGIALGNLLTIGGFVFGLLGAFAALVVAFIFYVLAASHLRKTFNSLAAHSGEASFTTAATLLWWGALLTIIVIGLLLIVLSWIFVTVGFFTMKSKQLQNGQAQNYSPQPPQPFQAKTIEGRENTQTFSPSHPL
jgi:uncharacterized membrane protein